MNRNVEIAVMFLRAVYDPSREGGNIDAESVRQRVDNPLSEAEIVLSKMFDIMTEEQKTEAIEVYRALR
jgi:hypothetical protein